MRMLLVCFVCIVYTQSLRAQVADQPSHTVDCTSECNAKKFRYIFCRPKPGAGEPLVELINYCSNNPNNEVDPITGQRMKVYRPSITNGDVCWNYERG